MSQRREFYRKGVHKEIYGTELPLCSLLVLYTPVDATDPN